MADIHPLSGETISFPLIGQKPSLKILFCHNFYQQPGGEDLCFAAEAFLLEAHGHHVVRFSRYNDEINRNGLFEVAQQTIWNRTILHELREIIRRERPAVMHCTNTFPIISPAAYYAARTEGLPVVQSLHNYRLFCLNAYLLRKDRVCEDCLRRAVPWPGLLHGCYRSSRAASAVVAAMLILHRGLRTWGRMVDRYIALTDFSLRKFVAGGLPAERLAVKPNFIDPDPGLGRGQGGYAVFIGRLSPEKGIKTLLSGWTELELGGRLPLKIIGDGPLASYVKDAAAGTPGIEWLGQKPPTEVLDLLGEAVCLVVPSIWYETFGRIIIEAYAKGTPVVASRLGAMAELVVDGHTGLLFETGNAADLALKVRSLVEDPVRLSIMRRNARREYEKRYTAERNYRMLMRIYEEAAIVNRRGEILSTQISGEPMPGVRFND